MARRSALGIDIGTKAIKVLQISGKSGEYSVTDFCRIPVDPDQPLGEQIGRAIRARQFDKGAMIIVGISGKNVFVRHHIMTSIADAKERRESVKFEIPKFIPGQDIEDLAFDSQKLEDLAANEKGERDMRALIVGVRRAYLETYLSALDMAKVEPDVIDVEACALFNAYALVGLINPFEADPKKTVTLVDVGASKTNLHIARGWDSFFARESYKGGNDVTEAIAGRFALGQQEAEQMKINPGENLVPVLESIDVVLQDIANEIRSAVDYFETQYEVPVDEILITGGASNTPGLAETAEKVCQKKVTKWRPVDVIPKKLPPEASEELAQNADMATMALGLAARLAESDFTEDRRPIASATSSVPIVLLPESQEQPPQSEKASGAG